MSSVQAKGVQKLLNQGADLATGRSAIQVQLIQHEVENTSSLNILPGFTENRFVLLTHQHHRQHAEIRDQDVGGRILHVPTRTHFRPIHGGKEILDFIALRPALFCIDFTCER